MKSKKSKMPLLAKELFNKSKMLHLLISGFAVSLAGCVMDEIPEIDETPPGFIFRITGYGVNAQFDQTLDFENNQLNLLVGKTYIFSYLASDQGGVGFQEISIGPYDQFELTNLSSALVINQTSGLTRYLSQLGELSSPQSALSIGGNIKPIDETTADFRFVVRDFGGSTGSPNQTNAYLRVYSTTDEDQLGLNSYAP